MFACRDGHTAVVKMLVEGGADLNAQNQVSGTVRCDLSIDL
jgi:ankyrin repeat protein